MTGADSKRPLGLRDIVRALTLITREVSGRCSLEQSREILRPECSFDHSGVCVHRGAQGARAEAVSPAGRRRGDPGRWSRSAQCAWREVA